VEVDKRWQEEIKKIDRGLFIQWSDEFKRWQIFHKDDRTGLTRRVMYVQDKDGQPCDFDMSLMRYLRSSIDWDRVGANPDPDKLYAKLMEDMAYEKKKQRLEDDGYIFDFNREHKKEWKHAMNQFLQTMPKAQLDLMKARYEHNKELNRKIIINFNRGD
jgi:hypothetical protein